MFKFKTELLDIIKRKFKSKAIITISIVIIVLLIFSFVMFLNRALFMSIATVLSRAVWQVDDTISVIDNDTGIDDTCTCGCIWIPGNSGNVVVNNTILGYIPGTVNYDNADSQIIRFMQVANSLYKKQYPLYAVYGKMYIESGATDGSKLFEGNGNNIYLNVMKPINGASAYQGNDLKNGSIISNGMAIGPFQIVSNFFKTWVKFADNDLILRAGGVIPQGIGNRGDTGQPLYLPDVLLGLVDALNSDLIQKSGFNEFMSKRYGDWNDVSDTVKTYLEICYFNIYYHGGVGLQYAKNNPEIFDFLYDFCKELYRNRDSFRVVKNWGASTTKNSQIIVDICSVIDPSGSKGYIDLYNNYANEGSTSYLIDWTYGPRALYKGMEHLEVALNNTGGKLVTSSNSLPSYGYTTGSLEVEGEIEVSGQKVIRLDEDLELLINEVLPAAKVVSERYEINTVTLITLAILEGGWEIYRDQSIAEERGYGLFYGQSGYNSYEESIINFAIDTYRTDETGFISSFNEGYIEQIRKIEGERSKYIGEMLQLANRDEIKQFDNSNVVSAYINSNNLREKYNKAVEIANELEGLYGLKIEPKQVEELDKYTNSNTVSNNNSHGYWVCDCRKPCAYCSCHDDADSSENKNIAEPKGLGAENFFTTPGQGQGIWGGKTTEEICAGDKVLEDTIQWWGTSGTMTYGPDLFKWKEAKFTVPYFSQIVNVKEDWEGYNYGYVNLKGSGCAIYMYAYIASALQQRLINPPEMLTLMLHFGAIQKGTGYFTYDVSAHNKLWGLNGYKVEMFTRSQANNDDVWAKLDESLLNNIPCGFRSGSYFTSATSHYLIISEKVGDKYRLAQTNNVSKQNQLYTREFLTNDFHRSGPCLYIISKDNK